LWLNYFCRERLKLTEIQVAKILQDLQEAMPVFDDLIERSHLSKGHQFGYREILNERAKRLGG
jgi:hypothetical protein